jgi:hypothetical protein
MKTFIKYQPELSISFGDIILSWKIARQVSRELLNCKFKTEDYHFDLNKYDNGVTSEIIKRRRDIYENYNGQQNFFFLNFDNNDKLTEIELHHGFVINIESVDIDFSMDIDKVAELLSSISNNKTKLSDGEYFFEKLKLTIASSEAMGGKGSELAYFYCSMDTSHLIENEVCS